MGGMGLDDLAHFTDRRGGGEGIGCVPKPFDPSHGVIVGVGIYIIDGEGDQYFCRFSDGSVTKVIHDARFVTDSR